MSVTFFNLSIGFYLHLLQTFRLVRVKIEFFPRHFNGKDKGDTEDECEQNSSRSRSCIVNKLI